ncbi:hypothetical protein TrVE_jg10554 [Triparma verrucosa]|uniref:Uncharacterized protein n=2 Tax=Triparma TaxID=722752 RepID=A0A9W7C5E5_9STRA|nr:hypothetical protein TrST_g7049 [Triparma strigata]GMI11478.1 hypothetical protein TrVE_jg10554 [Triparma verrucosa]
MGKKYVPPSFPNPDELKGAALGLCVYIVMYALLLSFQSFSKSYLLKAKRSDPKNEGKHISFLKTKYYNNSDIIALAGDRAVGNTLEQSLVFIPLLLAHTMLVDEKEAFSICVIYSLSRIIYPFLYLTRFFPAVFVSTVPGYCVCGYMNYKLFLWAIS